MGNENSSIEKAIFKEKMERIYLERKVVILIYYLYECISAAMNLIELL